jgi:hypothetical protein
MKSIYNLHLPDWPAERLVRESVVAWGFRHLDEEPCLDADSSPWPLVRSAVLSFLRHQHSDFDAKLRARREYDQAYRDQLALEIEQAAQRKYRWLGFDPRPFTDESSGRELALDGAAKQLANLHTLRQHLESAVRDLRRQGRDKEQISELQAEAARVARQIERLYRFLAAPKIGQDAGGKYSHSFTISHQGTERGYYCYTTRPLPPNRVDYIGIKCPRCEASIIRPKQPINLGQGFQALVFSCFCLTYAVHRPATGHRLQPMTLDYWTGLVQRTNYHKDD